MTKPKFRLPAAASTLLLAALPLLATAQTSRQDSLLRSGNLMGGRPHAGARTAAAAGTTRRGVANASADPGLTKIMHESIEVNKLDANQLLGVYDRFLDATRAQRRQWSAQDWDEASEALGRLNARYEAVRTDLPFNDRMTIRANQGEFRTLQGARRVGDRVRE